MKKRIRKQFGSVVLDKRSKTWHFIWWENGRRRSKRIGSRRELRTKAAAWKAAHPFVNAIECQVINETEPITVSSLVNFYRAEKMPRRYSTRRGYEVWLKHYILPRWGELPITDIQARPVELWLQTLLLAPKSKAHIRGLLSVLWDYAMWRSNIPMQRNPMELVFINDVSKRVRKARSLNVEEFHSLLDAIGSDLPVRTMLLLAVSFGLRISEALGLKWKDVDWLNKTVRIERGVVKQIVDEVKTSHSARAMVIADELLELLKQLRQESQFSALEDWIFASPAKLGRQPLSYTHIWEMLDTAGERAGLAHVSSHTFRHTHRTWLDSVGTPVGVQQKLMRHADIRTTMNLYGDAMTADMRTAHEKVVRLALQRV